MNKYINFEGKIWGIFQRSEEMTNFSSRHLQVKIPSSRKNLLILYLALLSLRRCPRHNTIFLYLTMPYTIAHEIRNTLKVVTGKRKKGRWSSKVAFPWDLRSQTMVAFSQHPPLQTSVLNHFPELYHEVLHLPIEESGQFFFHKGSRGYKYVSSSRI